MIGYRNADGSTVLPDGSVIKADGSRLPPGTSKYPPDPGIGGLHPITLPDPPPAPAATGLPFTVQASAPSYSGSFSGPLATPPVEQMPVFTARRVGVFAALIAGAAFVGYEIWRHK